MKDRPGEGGRGDAGVRTKKVGENGNLRHFINQNMENLYADLYFSQVKI
jgi:hypothetical protein